MRSVSLLAIGALTVAGMMGVACGSDEPAVDGTGGATGGNGTGGNGTGGKASGGSATGGNGSGGKGTGGNGAGGKGSGGADTGGTGGAMGGMAGDNMGGLGGMGGAEAAPMGFLFDSQADVDAWQPKSAANAGDGGFDTGIVRSLGTSGMDVDVTWPADADTAQANFYLETYGSWNLSGQTITLVIEQTELGIGSGATNADCGFDVFISVNDGTASGGSDYTSYGENAGEGGKTDAGVGEFCGDSGPFTFSITIPETAEGDFDPTDVVVLNMRITSKFWDGAAPFDYTTSTFRIASYTWLPTP